MSQKVSEEIRPEAEREKESVDPEQLIAELQEVVKQKDTDIQYLLHEVKRANLIIKNLQVKVGNTEGLNAVLMADLELTKG